MKHFSKKEDKFLKDNYLTIPAKAMSRMLGRSESGARQRMQVLGLIVPPEITNGFKKQSQFKEGHLSFNKGKKQSEYMADEAIARTKQTRFKKGQLPTNTKADGDISIRKDKRGVPYQFIRIAKAKWVPLQRYIWQKEKGDIPPKHKIVFIDGDTMNCSIANLQMVSCAGLMKKNTVHNYPKPIAKMVLLRGALNRKINKLSKQLNNEEQN